MNQEKKIQEDKFVIMEPNGAITVVMASDMLKRIKDDNCKDTVMGKLIPMTEVTKVEKLQMEVEKLQKKSVDTKNRLMSLVRQNSHLLANRSQQNLIYNFREMIFKEL